jgi:hypothetical protein
VEESPTPTEDDERWELQSIYCSEVVDKVERLFRESGDNKKNIPMPRSKKKPKENVVEAVVKILLNATKFDTGESQAAELIEEEKLQPFAVRAFYDKRILLGCILI